MSIRLRDSSGETIEKNGFSVVAATSVIRAVLDRGQQGVLLGLGEAVDLVEEQHRLDVVVGQVAAGLLDDRPHVLTPAFSADMATSRRLPDADTMEAMVVLPVPGGPHRMSDIGASPSTSRRSGDPGASRWSWPDDLVQRARPHPGGQRRVHVDGGQRAVGRLASNNVGPLTPRA